MVSKTVYEPLEDSIQLSVAVKKYSHGDVLDLGCGSGIQGITAMTNKLVNSVTFSDINPHAIIYVKKRLQSLKKKYSEKNISKYTSNNNNNNNNNNNSNNNKFSDDELISNFYKSKETSFIISDLFSKIDKKFDTIIFNPPYLPEDEFDKETLITTGGKNGYEIIIEFLNQSKNYLKKNGTILLLISSLSNKKIIDEHIKNIGFKKFLISKQSLFMEQLFVYQIKINQNNLLKGHRGEILQDYIILDGKKIKVAIKTAISKNYNSQKEAKYLEELNKYGIGPKLFSYTENSLTMEFIDGIRIIDFFMNSSKKQKIDIIRKILEQCVKMDELKINKYELTNPYKHIIIRSESNKFVPVMIDFERCSKSLKTKNVTQFIQFLISKRIVSIFKNSADPLIVDSESLKTISKNYKNSDNLKNFSVIDSILSCIK